MDLEIKRWLERSRTLWMMVFGVIFLLSIDFWNWGSDEVVFGFLPLWVFRIILLQFLLSGAILLFVKFYWKDGGEQ